MDRSTFDPGPLADVSAHEEPDGRWTIVFVRDLAHPPDAVWSALTDPEQLRAWSPFTADRDLDRTGEAQMTMLDDSAERFGSTVSRVEAPAVLEYSWGDGVVRWELAPTDAGTRLTLRHNLPNPADGPKVAAGWHLCLVVADQLLAGNPIGPIVGQEAMGFGWQDLHDAYAAALGQAGEQAR